MPCCRESRVPASQLTDPLSAPLVQVTAKMAASFSITACRLTSLPSRAGGADWHSSGGHREGCRLPVSTTGRCPGPLLPAAKVDRQYLPAACRVQRLLNVKLWPGEDNKGWKSSVQQKGFGLLCVSQFTLHNSSRGNRPDFHTAMPGNQVSWQWFPPHCACHTSALPAERWSCLPYRPKTSMHNSWTN